MHFQKVINVFQSMVESLEKKSNRKTNLFHSWKIKMPHCGNTVCCKKELDAYRPRDKIKKLRPDYEAAIREKDRGIRKWEKEEARAHVEAVTVRKYWSIHVPFPDGVANDVNYGGMVKAAVFLLGKKAKLRVTVK